MKTKIVFLLAFCLYPILNWGQANFIKYESMKEVSAMVITQNMFKLLSEIDLDTQDQETQAYIDLIENLKDIKVLTTNNVEIGTDMNTDFNSYVESSQVEELMRFKEKSMQVKFYSKPGSKEGFVSELLMLMTGQEEGEPITVVMSIQGDIDLKQVSKLANDLKVPGAKQLKNIK